MIADANPAPGAWIERADRLRFRVTGPDRAATLHNLTTNDVKNLKPGFGLEAFVTSLQGKTLAHVAILADPDALIVLTDAPCAATLDPHYAKYAALDDSERVDETDASAEFHVVDSEPARAILADSGFALAANPDAPEFSHETATPPGFRAAARLIRHDPTGRPGWTWIVAAPDRDAARELLATLPRMTADAFEAARIRAGTPLSGVDATADNLPQEFERDARAISFRKGCYLGQETVARLDALGHVNKVARVLELEPEPESPGDSDSGSDPEPPIFDPRAARGAPVLDPETGKVVGGIASAVAEAPGRGVAFAIVRVKFAEPGAALRVELAGNPWKAVVRAIPATT